MIFKKLLPVFAIVMVCMFILPGYVEAADGVEKTINLEIESEHQDEYDEVVNIANESSIQNPDTWDPAAQGIWLGSSTRESKFKFDAIATTSNRLQVGSTLRFNRTQIMNGGSEFIVRSPISAEGVLTQTLAIIEFPGNASYQLEARTATNTGDGVYVAFININMSDTSITTGEDCWTLNDRTYVLVRCPIYAGINYVFIWTATYDVDKSFTIYVSGQDIANDNFTETQISYYTRPEPDVYNELVRLFEVDPGISFDFLTGLGNGVYANSFYMHAGDSIQFKVSNNAMPEAYHTIMVPFGTDDGTLNATVTVERWNINVLVPFWSNGSRVWNDYILASTNATKVAGTWSPLLVTITVHEEKRVNWIFADAPSGTPVDYSIDYSLLTLDGIEHTVYSRVWNSYQPSLFQIYAPSMTPSDFPAWMEPEQTDKANWYGTIIGACMIVVGAILVATGILAPVGGVLMGTGALMIIADLAKGGHLWGGGPVSGWMHNALDDMKNFFEDVGEFIISIGEGLWDAVTWLADTIVEFGAYLIGMILIAVALYIFFYFIQFQFKLWSYALAMAEGDFRGAGREANGILKDLNKGARTTVRIAGKANRSVRRASKAYSKRRKERDDEEDEGGDEQ